MLFTTEIIAILHKYPGRNAFCIRGQFYTYAAFGQKIATLKKELLTNWPAQQNIGLVVTDEIETYAAYIAIMLAGKTCVPIHPTHPADRASQIIELSELKVVFSAPARTYEGITMLDSAALCAQHVSDEIIAPTIEAEQTNAYILFTSGTTGIPKGVPITYRNLDSFIRAFHALGYKLNEEDRFLQMFDLTFDLSVMSFVIPLCLGGCVYTVSDIGMKYTNIYGILEEHRITCALMVPSVITFLRPYFDEVSLPDMRYSLFCGEALHKDVVAEWAACVPNAVVENVYGPTEATIFCLTYNVNAAATITDYHGIVSLGKPMENMEAIVVDENDKQLPNGDKGQLCLYGAQLTPGYLSAEKTKEAFFDAYGKRYYRTGDIAFVNVDGDFMYCGRVDHQVKVQGYRVELSEIEFHLRKISGKANVVAVLVNANGNDRIDAIFEGAQYDTSEIVDGLKSKLPSYMIPSQVHFVGSFPLNANGKTDRNALKKMIVL
jgi:D-alanine--poly(phosphoribitol) ligase subunit 1